MSWSDEAHEKALKKALAGLEGETFPTGEAEEDDLISSYLETFAALPLALEAEIPAEEIRQKLLQSIATSTQSVSEQSAQRPSDPAPAQISAFRAPPRQRPLWPSALAATLTLCVLGLGIYSFNLNQRLQLQEQTLSELGHAIMVGHMEAEATPAQGTFGETLKAFPAVATSTSRLFPMHAKRESRLQGAMLLCAKHQQWYIHLKGLEPAAAGQEYHLWFLTENGPISLGTLDIEAGKPFELTAHRMPKGVQGLLVSLEPRNTHSTRPEGHVVLEGTTSIEV